jgi:hypothetical protein
MLLMTHRGFPWLMLLLIASGCGGGATADRKPTSPVSGKITLAGGPVAGAYVTFAPKSGQPVATGQTDSAGEYRLTTYEAHDGAVAGDFVVLVIKPSANPTKGLSAEDYHRASASGQIPVSHGGSSAAQSKSEGSGLPERYSDIKTSDLKATVKPDVATYDFELKP